MRRSIIIFLAVFVFTSGIRAQTYNKESKELDKFILEGIDLWEPPGLAVAVVKDGKTVFLKGYGVTNAESPKNVDVNTLFLCASTTKAFTAAGLAILVDDGKVDWDDKVIDHLPSFKLKDPYMTRELTVRDLLTHRSGLGNSDYLWTTMSISADSAILRLIDSDYAYSPRSGFIYQNLMYSTAGKVIEAASEMSWGDFLKKRIYTPLGMNDTYPYLKDVESKGNKADAHYRIDKKITPVGQLSADAIGPAGSMWSSITDMSKWIAFLTNNAIINGDTIISSKTFNELFVPQQLIPASQFYPSQQLTKPSWKSYGLGWFQHDYNGDKVDFHTGSLPGMVAIAGLIREKNTGVYVFSNLDHAELRHSIMYAALDLFGYGKLSRDWNTDLKEIYDKGANDDEEPVKIEDAPPSIPLDSLIGEYTNDKYGTVRISLKDNDLYFSLNGTVNGSIEHWHYDTYQISYDREWYGEGMINFRMNSEAKIEYLDFWGSKYSKIKE